MKLLALILVLISSFSGAANDGAYFSSGGIFYPMKETVVSIEKEILSFTVRDKQAAVHIYFEFLNPTSKPITMDVGFVCPFPSGDVGYEDFNSKGVKNFTVQLEEKHLEFKKYAARCPDCELYSISEIDTLNQYDQGNYVYMFQITFMPGINKVNHSYDFSASGSVVCSEEYNYTLTTGALWAGGEIKDFTLEIDMPKEYLFFVEDVFLDKATWSIIGTGKRCSGSGLSYHEQEIPTFKIANGKLSVTCKNLTPEKDIYFGVSMHNPKANYFKSTYEVPESISKFLRFSKEQMDYSSSYYSIETLTLNELRILRNSMYAENGYSFNSIDLNKFFSQFCWYLPNSNLNIDDVLLTVKEKELISLIVARENSLKLMINK